MGWKTFNDRLALVVLGLIGLLLGFLVWREPGLRRDVLILLGPWGTIVIQYYFRKQPPAGPGA